MSLENAPVLNFKGTNLDLVVLSAPNPAPAFQVWRNQFAGVKGESELRGKAGSRMLEFQVLVCGEFETRDKLRDYCDKTLNDKYLGEHGDLKYTSTGDEKWKATWKHCTCEGFTATTNMLPDEAGTLDGGWFVSGTLKFHQLHSGDDS